MCTEELCTIIAASPLNVGQVICTTQAQLNCSKHTGDKSPSTFRCAIWRPLFYLTDKTGWQECRPSVCLQVKKTVWEMARCRIHSMGFRGYSSCIFCELRIPGGWARRRSLMKSKRNLITPITTAICTMKAAREPTSHEALRFCTSNWSKGSDGVSQLNGPVSKKKEETPISKELGWGWVWAHSTTKL